MKKKILALCLIVAMLGVAVVGGTMAYFTDTDEAVNVMTIGSVKIEQIEEEWNETEKKLQPFTQAKELLPYVGSITGWDKVATGYPRFAGIKNAIDKFVSVKNTGRSDAYVRTFIALEVGTGNDNLLGVSIDNLNSSEGGTAWAVVKQGYETIDGNNYYVFVFEHKEPLKAGEQTIPCFRQVYLKPEATQEDAAKLDGNDNGTYDILSFTQAVQAGGFASAREAFKASFDENSDTIKMPWAKIELPVVVTTAEELQATINAADEGENYIVLGADIVGNVTVAQKPNVKIDLDGNGYAIDGAITVNGRSARYETAGMTIHDIKFYADSITLPNDTAYINLGESGDSNTRYTNHVTISNCTFDAANVIKVAAVKSYTGGDWNLTIKDCVVTEKIHSLLQVANVEKNLIISGCTVNSKNGVNLNSTPSVEITDCNFDVRGYAVRFGVNGSTATEAKTFVLTNNTLKSACEESDDAVIVFRENATNATLTLEGNTIIGTRQFIGTTANTVIIEK